MQINCKNTTKKHKIVLLTPLILSHFTKEVERDFQSNYSMCKTSAVHMDATNMNKICWDNNTSAVATILFAKLSDAECVSSRAVPHVLFAWWSRTQLYRYRFKMTTMKNVKIHLQLHFIYIYI
jgi:hypothetical protein